MRAQSRVLNLAAAVIAASVTVIASAQEPQKQSPEKPGESTQGDQSDSIIVCPIYLTTINVSVTDSNNRSIPNLSHEDFAIFEDDVEQQIVSWFHDDSSVSFIALVVKSEDEISAAVERIIRRLKNQYTITYSPTNEKYDGSFRNVRVTVTPIVNRKVKVFAPSGYYAVDPEKIREEKTNDK